MRKLLMAAAAITLMITTMVLTSCTDNYDDKPVVVTDNKPFTYDSEIDESVRPGDDFYRYCLGKWLDSADPEPSMLKQMETQLKNILENALDSNDDPLLVKLRSQADETLADDSRNVALLLERLQMLENVQTADQLYTAFGTLYELGYSPLFRLIPMGISGKKTALTFTTGGVTEYMLKEVYIRKKTEQIDSLVHVYCQPLYGLGYSDERIAQIIGHAIAVVTAEAQNYKSGYEMPYQLRAPGRSADNNTAQKVLELYEMMGLTADDFDSVRVAHTVSGIRELLYQFASVGDNQEKINAYRDYMIYNVVAQDAPFVPSAGTQTDRKAMLVRALQYNRYYKYRQLVQYYGEENIYKQECLDILERMRQAFIRRVDNLDWMGDATKAEARRKAESMKFYVGYPEQWNDAMTPVPDGDCLLATVTKLRQEALLKNLSLVGKSVDENAWDFWANLAQFTTDNAFYHPTFNSLVILPAWLIKPRFDNALSDATLYATAVTFAHEFCHGFDYSGSQYDADGCLRDWWEPADKQAFLQKQQAMVALFNQLEAYPGQPADGQKTLAENMADYGGVELTLECYKKHLEEQGYDKEQIDVQIRKFFLAYAQNFKFERERSLDELRKYYEIDDHSAAHNRINGMMRLQDDWYRLYDVQPTDKLYLAPQDRVKIW